MRTFDFSRYALNIGIAAAFLAGCAGSQPPIVAPGAVPAGGRDARRGSWMLPEARREPLLYISDYEPPSVHVFSYRSHLHVGELTGFYSPNGQCVDKNGDVWITDGNYGEVVEYAHGGYRPLKTLNIKSYGTAPNGCSVSPNGDLAVSVGHRANLGLVNLNGSSSPVGGVLVYKNASGPPVYYGNVACNQPPTPGYDIKGNLYVEGIGSYPYYQGSVCELPVGGKSLKLISFKKRNGTNVEVDGYGSVMWDGKHIAVTSGRPGTILQASESPNGNLTLVRATPLLDTNCHIGVEFDNVFLVGPKNTPENTELATTAVSPNDGQCPHDFDAWAYPEGGKQVWSVTVGVSYGVSVSRLP